jgi:hypothetical protein
MEEYKAIYESMKAQQEDDGTNTFVFKLVEGLIGKPANARSDWPYIADLKTVIEKLPNVKVPQNPKRAVLIQLIALTWRNLSDAQRPALTFAVPAVTAAAAAAPPPPAAVPPPPQPPRPQPPPASLAEVREQLEFVEKADAHMLTSDGRTWSVAEDVVDEEEEAAEEEEQWQAEAAAAESLVEPRRSSS